MADAPTIFPSEARLMSLTGLTAEQAAKAREIGKSRSVLTLAVDADRFPRTAAWLKACFNQPSAECIRMNLLDEVCDTYGVETIYQAGRLVYEYLNTGETYNCTLVQRWDSGGYFFLSSWGDLVEHNPKLGT